MQYDTTEYTVKVVVEDPKADGNLEATVLYGDEKLSEVKQQTEEELTEKPPLEFVNNELMKKCKLSIKKKWMLNDEPVEGPVLGNVESITIHLYRTSGEDGDIEECDTTDPADLRFVPISDANEAVKPFVLTAEDNWEKTDIELPNYREDEEGKPVGFTYFFVEDPNGLGIWNPTEYSNGNKTEANGSDLKLTRGGTVVITNSAYTVSLPATGGPGTTLHIISGISLVALALAMLLKRRKA